MGTATGAILAVWMALAAAATLGCAWYLRLLGRPQPRPGAAPPVLVAVPVRGGAGLEAFLSALAGQDYPAWRAVFAVEDRADPAFPALARFAAEHPSRFAVVVAGAAERRAQKVQNLLATLPALRPGDAALVTLDADTVPPPDMLTELLRPVLTGQGDLSSGYRWTLPASRGAAGSLLLSLAEMGVATLPRCARCNLCWGGATAISRRALERLDLPSLWKGAVSDDMSLSRAAHRAGLVIYAPLTVRPPSPTGAGLGEALRFGVRQHRLMRMHSPGRWLLAGSLLALPAVGAGAAAVAAAGGSRAALLCLGAALLLQRARAALRGAIARRVLPPNAAAEAVRALRRGRWWQPLAHALHVLAWAGSAAGRHLDWAGRRYRLTARGEVLGVRRSTGGGA